MIRLTDITKDFPSPSGDLLRVLEGVDLEQTEGGSIAIQRLSGNGKSTLLGILAESEWIFTPYPRSPHATGLGVLRGLRSVQRIGGQDRIGRECRV